MSKLKSHAVPEAERCWQGLVSDKGRCKKRGLYESKHTKGIVYCEEHATRGDHLITGDKPERDAETDQSTVKE